MVEAGAAGGALAAAVLGAAPECRDALRYVCVETSQAARAAARERLPAELPSLVLGPRLASRDADDASEPAGVARRGPLVTVLEDLPAEPFAGMVVANELLDNLPVELLEWRDGQWLEVRVGEAGDRPVEVLVPAPAPSDSADSTAASAARLVDSGVLRDGARLPLQRTAAAWLARVLNLVAVGRVVCVDYCVPTTAMLAGRDNAEWLRTYRGHGRGGHPLDRPGAQDITCEVAVDQLAPRPTTGRR